MAVFNAASWIQGSTPMLITHQEYQYQSPTQYQSEKWSSRSSSVFSKLQRSSQVGALHILQLHAAFWGRENSSSTHSEYIQRIYRYMYELRRRTLAKRGNHTMTAPKYNVWLLTRLSTATPMHRLPFTQDADATNTQASDHTNQHTWAFSLQFFLPHTPAIYFTWWMQWERKP